MEKVRGAPRNYMKNQRNTAQTETVLTKKSPKGLRKSHSKEGKLPCHHPSPGSLRVRPACQGLGLDGSQEPPLYANRIPPGIPSRNVTRTFSKAALLSSLLSPPSPPLSPSLSPDNTRGGWAHRPSNLGGRGKGRKTMCPRCIW